MVRRDASRTGRARSYDHLGTAYEWVPLDDRTSSRWALDVERLQGRAPPLSRDGDEVAFLLRWTRTEVAAKLLGIPAVVAWKRLGAGMSGDPGPQRLAVEGVVVETQACRVGALVYSVGQVRGAELSDRPGRPANFDI